MIRIARALAFALAALVFFAAPPATAENPMLFTDFRTGVAINGYDPVAYFTQGEPRQGDPAFAYEWNGATWHFASAEHRDAFAADPERYAPKYGGFCAYAVAKGNRVPADPKVWSIVDDRLYLNLSPNVQKVWEEDRRDYILAADRNWTPEIVEPGRTKFEPAGAGNR